VERGRELDSYVAITIRHYCLDTCGPCNYKHYLGHVNNVYDDDDDLILTWKSKQLTSKHPRTFELFPAEMQQTAYESCRQCDNYNLYSRTCRRCNNMSRMNLSGYEGHVTIH